MSTAFWAFWFKQHSFGGGVWITTPMTSPSHWYPRMMVDAHVWVWFAWDSACNIILARVHGVRATWSPVVSEMAAVVYGLEIAIRMGYSFIHLVTDNSSVIQGIFNESSGFSPFYLMLDSVLHLQKGKCKVKWYF